MTGADGQALTVGNAATKAVQELEKKVALRTNQTMQLPFWSEDRRGVPNEIVRSALFTIRNPRTKRRYYKQECLFVLGPAEVTYQGEELRTDDEDVWMQILHLAREFNLGEWVEFTPYSLLKSIHWPRTSHYYDKLRQTLTRMQATALTVQNSKRFGNDKGVSLSLISRFEWDSNKKWRVKIETEMLRLFGDQHYAQLEWEIRSQLNPLGKRLYDYFSSHRQNYPVKIENLQKLCGSESSSKEFRRSFRSAMSELEGVGFLENWQIKDSGAVSVVRTGTTPH